MYNCLGVCALGVMNEYMTINKRQWPQSMSEALWFWVTPPFLGSISNCAGDTSAGGMETSDSGQQSPPVRDMAENEAKQDPKMQWPNVPHTGNRTGPSGA